ncbi:MAG: uroporphyrinogen-III C-methyltransferase [Nannocystaceae bacterium]|nr:uroporphyrinogen-III C-methyltransferase [bacterium]
MNFERPSDEARLMIAVRPKGAGLVIGQGRELLSRVRYLSRSDTPMEVWTDAEHARRIRDIPELASFVGPLHATEDGLADDSGRFRLRFGVPAPFDTAAYAVVFLCDLEESVSQRWYDHARQCGSLVNDADVPHRCDFDVPALHRDGPVRIGISTSGTAPGMAGRLRKEIALALPPQTGDAVRRFASLRPWNKTTWGRPRLRRLARKASIRELAALDTGDELRARRVLAAAEPNGHVVLIGAGPGDPEMLTLEALRWLSRADLIVADRLVAKAMREGLEGLTTAQWRTVNKPRGGATHGQRELERWTSEAAREGKTVVRLKSGDCGFFARTGEELLCYRELGIEVTVVAGVSAIHASSAAAQIPLTWRGYADRVKVVTAVGRDDSEPIAPGYDASCTLVILMGVKVIRRLVERLVASGHPPDISAAVIEKASTTDERVFTGSLRDLPDIVARNGVTAPATIVVGHVVAAAVGDTAEATAAAGHDVG